MTLRPPAASAAPQVAAGSSYLAAAAAIAAELVETAVPTPSGVRWTGDDWVGHDEATLAVARGPVGPDLYGGTAGIGWFLGHFSAAVGDARMADVAVDAIRFSLDAVERGLESSSPSLFSGAAGVALAAVVVAGRLRRPQLGRRARVLARRVASLLCERPHAFEGPDLLSGLAGVLVALLAIHRGRRDPLLMKGCRVACERLLALRHADGSGTCWPEPGGAPGPGLCGLGHGASGVAWALAEAGWTTGNRPALAVVEEALRYERAWFSTERCAWADLRRPPAAFDSGEWPAWTTAWCHGALGIGAVRLRIYEATRDLTALAEATAAIESARRLVAGAAAALRQSHATDVTLCHGLAGAVDLMLLAYEITGMREHLRAARRAGDLSLSIRAANGGRWTVGVRGGEQVPGLFLGRAGIGVVLMRLHDPRLIASPMLPGRPRARRE
jgi:lantibiotic modifying enzyme